MFQTSWDSAGQVSQEGRYKNMAKGKANRNLELNEKSRQLTESLKQLQQSYSSSNIQVHSNKLINIVVFKKDKSTKVG